MRLQIKVIPKASKDRVIGWLGDRLKIAVTAAPERGKANEAVIALLASTLELPASRIRIVAGLSHPLKTLELDLSDEERLMSRLPPR
jgi:hypothetical protein